MESIAVKELIYSLADNLLIYGHRNSEWIGLGPLLEEDISFASIAQDKVGQSRVLYNLLHQLGEADADTVAFTRNASQFHNCILAELPCQLYEQALVRHFLFDEAQAIYFDALKGSTQPDLAAFATKFTGEIKYHTLHARAMIKRLMQGSEEANIKIKASFDALWPYCGGLFEPSPYEQELIALKVIPEAKVLQERWQANVLAFCSGLGLELEPALLGHKGGRMGNHSEYLQPMLDEMSEVFNLDPSAQW
jgi:ring-1,2-phenylacetyl-CoA epoxidase subunit PaaC